MEDDDRWVILGGVVEKWPQEQLASVSRNPHLLVLPNPLSARLGEGVKGGKESKWSNVYFISHVSIVRIHEILSLYWEHVTNTLAKKYKKNKSDSNTKKNKYIANQKTIWTHYKHLKTFTTQVTMITR